MKKRLIVSFSIIVVIIALYFAVGNYFYNFALNANAEKDFLEDNPHLQASPFINKSREKEEKALDNKFKEIHTSQSLKITSRDELKLQLRANYFEQTAPTHKWAFVVHGYTSKANDMTRWVRNFYEQGFNVVAPDLRGHGASEGNYIGMGWHDRLDLMEWIHLVLMMDPDAEIVLFGVSMGAATVLMASGEELPDNVKVIVEDCGYSSVADVFTYQLKDLFSLPEFPFMNAANTVTNIRANYDIYEASALTQVEKSVTPTLFIHGDEDTFVPYEMVNELYEAAPVEKEKLIIEHAGHGEAVRVSPDIYWATVWEFVSRFIN